jgi:hypothetical protein
MSVKVFQEMIGQVFDGVYIHDGSGEVLFENSTMSVCFYHDQDCCENVYVESHDGDPNWLVGSPIIQAEQVDNIDIPDTPDNADESYTWTFYKFATVKGSVTVRFFGSSNGYYSEDVDCDIKYYGEGK